ncbi:MAG: protein-export chaperone SecB [Steroidobacteraceae bacterium]|nr:protein-export chaperone SecB [Steroidobacteraceae bacterium]MCW5571970.1 protein-export chaperone SecB [Steroidobacteraceae bacterium]
MSTETAGTTPAEATGPQLALQVVYLKDCSFEAPQGPRVESGWNPQINLDINTSFSTLGEDLREVLLTVTVSAKQGEQTAFLVEVKQAGAFLMRNLSDDDTKRALTTICPGTLFPYARAAISHLVMQGGFPQFLLPPVNFDALYARSLADGQNATKN